MPMAVPWTCRSCFPLNSKLLYFRIKVRSLTRVSVGGSLKGLSSQASLHARMSSSCGILVYRDFPSKAHNAYRRPKSLRDILVHAKLNPDPSDDGPTGKSKPCGNKRCFTCKLMKPTQIAKSSSGASVKLKRQTNCKSENVIYLITCTQCGKQYVGDTKRSLNERMNGHRSNWTK